MLNDQANGTGAQGMPGSASDSPSSGRRRIPTGDSARSPLDWEGDSSGDGSDSGGDSSNADRIPALPSLPGQRSPSWKRVEVPMEIVVACGPNGVVIHPGGYRLSPKALKGKDEVLAKSLKSIVRNRELVDPLIKPRPSVRFLVEPGGNEVYRQARRQTVLSGLDWPVVLQIADTRIFDIPSRSPF